MEVKDTTAAMKMIGWGLAGAGVALLLAPKSGRDTRRNLLRYARTFGGRTHHAVYDFSSNISEFIDTLADKANEILNTGEELSEDAKRGLITALEKGQERLERQKQKLSQMMR